MKEYIFPVQDTDWDEFKKHIGFIRTKPELIRCKDCVRYCDNSCSIHPYEPMYDNDFCSRAERKEKE